MARKNPILFDLNTGIVGTYVQTDGIAGETGLVDIQYKPLNSFKTLVLRAIPEKAIHLINMPKVAEGIQDSYMIVMSDSKGNSSLISMVLDRDIENVNALREKLNESKIETRQAKHQAEESSRSIDRQKKKELDRTRRPSSPFGGLGGLGGYPVAPMGGNAGNPDGDDFLENF